MERTNDIFIIIDHLDEEWVAVKINWLKLIQSLMDTCREFAKVKDAKIIVALRADLLKAVVQGNTTAGFQDEKYHSLYLHMRWTERELRELVDKRIGKPSASRYTTQGATFDDLLKDAPCKRPKAKEPIYSSVHPRSHVDASQGCH